MIKIIIKIKHFFFRIITCSIILFHLLKEINPI